LTLVHILNIAHDINAACLIQIDTEIAVTCLVEFYLYVYL